MKLSELAPREHIALEVLPALVATGTMTAGDAAWQAFCAADAFLKRAGRENDKITQIKRECDKLEAQNSILLNMNEDGQFIYRVALLEIWEFLGVKDQTAAMEELRQLKAEISVLGEHPHD